MIFIYMVLLRSWIICSPFLGVYYGAKWIYNHNPSKKLKEKENETKNS